MASAAGANVAEALEAQFGHGYDVNVDAATINKLADVPADYGPTVATIGNFDGVHRGHRAVLDRKSVV